jgi:hypothetical protein
LVGLALLVLYPGVQQGARAIGLSPEKIYHPITMLLNHGDRVREEYQNGGRRARADVTKGVLAIAYAESAQLPPSWFYYAELLWTNCGVQRVVFSLPANPRAAEAWARGYNEVAQREIQQRFGTNILNYMMAEAQTMYDRTYERKRRKTNL